ncbi:3-dehydro-L-gulonate 2-dehydrogenase [Mucilaginibacter sp. RS28]|uniref:3-dehydro-L-gulonate 2-dehydrogenase n=2 Tax=Mucilaginibacter straminoryzae TaxID=2932774 RepID=A0A9X1X776_9SPHI|nr:3-dehydro-L-gulonate 2-dehydrogenase [Mucilaginibacter straminoryzae]
MKAEFKRILLNHFTEAKAEAIATVFTENSRDGVYTHGLNRFPTFIQMVKQGAIKTDAEPELVSSFGSIEKWDGNYGPGVLNAGIAMGRAIALANEYGIGCVAIRNTNHWMRGGTYGWQAAEAGMISICFTNTIANLPPWGGLDPRLGNNPLIIAVPRKDGHVVLDMAVSQYSFGKLKQYESQGRELPLPGGYDEEGNLSTDASTIIKSGRLMPAGFWKGSGLSLMLDLLATVLSDGRSTAEVSKDNVEAGLSQLFICIKPTGDSDQHEQLIQQILDYAKSSTPIDPDDPIRYPGEGTILTRERNLKEGIPVDEKIWESVLKM